MSRLVKPKRPVGYSRQNWNTREDYEQAVRIYEMSLAIYLTLGGKP